MLLIVAIGVILFIVIMVLKAKSSKSRTITIQENDHNGYNDVTTKRTEEVTGENTKVFYYRKKHGIGTAVNIIPKYFPNGSALVITSDGNRQRKKMKHCFV